MLHEDSRMTASLDRYLPHSMRSALCQHEHNNDQSTTTTSHGLQAPALDGLRPRGRCAVHCRSHKQLLPLRQTDRQTVRQSDSGPSVQSIDCHLPTRNVCARFADPFVIRLRSDPWRSFSRPIRERSADALQTFRDRSRRTVSAGAVQHLGRSQLRASRAPAATSRQATIRHEGPPFRGRAGRMLAAEQDVALCF